MFVQDRTGQTARRPWATCNSRKLSVFAALWSFAACGTQDLYIPLPPGTSASGSVIIAVKNGAGWNLSAHSGEESKLLTARVASDFDIVALVYPESLSRLDLEAGVLEIGDPSECGARALPAGADVFRVGASGMWRPEARVEDSLASIRIRGVCPCGELEVTRRILLPREPRRLLVRGRNILAFDQRRVLRIGPDDAIDEFAPGLVFSDPRGVVDDPGRGLWVGSETGMFFGDLDRGFTRTATIPTQGNLRALDGGPGPRGLELYVTTDRGELIRRVEGVYEALVGPETRPMQSGQRARLVWRGPEHVVFSVKGTLDLIQYTEGTIQRAELPVATEEVAQLAAAGDDLYVLTRMATLLRFGLPELHSTGLGPALPEPDGALGLDDGVLYVGNSGYVQQYVRGFGFCPTQFVFGQPPLSNPRHIDDEMVVLGKGGDGPELIRFRLSRP